ncbi:MAG: hypothetical protein M3139_05590 [Bacteroidota bacterium]|nr:hypothetical protein [Bacteroidota bacterium]
MTKYILIAFLICGNCTQAQNSNQPVKLIQYVFEQFNPGTVKLKSGKSYKQNLNYNTITNEMVFVDNGKFVAIASPESVDTIYISDRKFIPLNNKFYEVLVTGPMPLLAELTATVSEEGTSIGYGSTTTTSATSSYQSLIRDGGAYGLKLPDGFKVTPKQEFYILKDDKLERISNERQLAKIFPDKKDVIKDFVKKTNTNFSKSEDVAALVKQLE